MAVESLRGNSSLFDPKRGVVLRGEIRLTTDGKSRSEIYVENDVTGVSERLVFQTGSLWIPVMQLIQVIQEAHSEVDVGLTVIDGLQGACCECDGLGEITDDEGNWDTCPMCGGRV